MLLPECPFRSALPDEEDAYSCASPHIRPSGAKKVTSAHCSGCHPNLRLPPGKTNPTASTARARLPLIPLGTPLWPGTGQPLCQHLGDVLRVPTRHGKTKARTRSFTLG